MVESSSSRKGPSFRWVSRRAGILEGVLTLLACAAVVFSFVEIRAQKNKVLLGLTRLAAEELSHKVENFFLLRFEAIGHFRDLMHAGKISREETFLQAARVFRKRFPGFLAINWVDEKGVIRWVSPLEGNRAARGKNLFHHPEKVIRETFSSVASGKTPLLSPPARLYQGDLGVAAYFPVTKGRRPAGFLNAVFGASRLRSFLGGLEVSRDLLFQVEDGDRILIRNGEGGLPSRPAWQEGLPVRVLNRTWTVKVAPGRALVARIFPGTDWAFLAMGLLLALALGWSLFFARSRLQESRKALLALRTSENRYRHLLENMREGICLFREGRARIVNRRMEEILGYAPKELEGKEMKAFLPEVARVLSAGEESPSRTWEGVFTRKDGSTFPAEVGVLAFREGEDRMVQVVLRDLTRRKAMEEERERVQARLLETQKLESLGLLAGGIAHDFNNLLTGILGNASLAEVQLPEESPVRKTLGEVVDASRRAASLVRALLAYAGRGPVEKKVMDLSREVERVERLLPHALLQGVELRVSAAEGLPPVEGDPAQLQQVVMNLVVNAAEAAASGGALVQVSTGERRLEAGEVGPFAGGLAPPPGRYVFLRVEDDGPGMEEKTLSRIFDPFFSTKGPGRGLGLAAVLGIMKSWRGGVRVESRPGGGTRIEVLFPAVALASPPGESRERPISPEGTGTILVVDDEAMVGNLARSALEGFGFRVFLAGSGAEALEIFRREGGKIDLVVLDMVMPGMNGRETLEALRSLRPGLKVILTSGFPEGARPGEPGEDWSGFLMKPFTPLDLAVKVAEVLGRD